MSTMSRFMGESGDEITRLVANPDMAEPALSLQVLFPEGLHLSELGLTKALREHPLSEPHARVEIDQDCVANGTPLGLAGWGDHVIRWLGFNAPIPRDELAFSLQVSHCDQALKGLARQHESHLILYYAGYSEDPLSQYEALATFAGIFADMGALMVVNLHASSCLPADLLSPKANPVFTETVKSVLPTMLYCGFIKYFIEGGESGWVRTKGADALHLPDFAAYLPNMKKAEDYLAIFTDLHDYIVTMGKLIHDGDTVQLPQKRHIKLRAVSEDEYFLESDGMMLVIESGSEFESKRVAARKVKRSKRVKHKKR